MAGTVSCCPISSRTTSSSPEALPFHRGKLNTPSSKVNHHSSMAQATFLSSNDSAVLGALFDPEASLSASTQVGTISGVAQDDPEIQAVRESERSALLSLSGENPGKCDIEKSISELSTIIRRQPQYASAFNNRAQAERMLFNLETSTNSMPDEMLGRIAADLDEAISLASPRSAIQTVSEEQARVLASAHTHKGHLLWSASKSTDLANALQTAVPALKGLDAEALEEAASREFALGGRYGNETARSISVKINPFAKLCGSIVREAMVKDLEDYYRAS